MPKLGVTSVLAKSLAKGHARMATMKDAFRGVDSRKSWSAKSLPQLLQCNGLMKRTAVASRSRLGSVSRLCSSSMRAVLTSARSSAQRTYKLGST